ncbi:hypothetical protein YC2023_071122 [Brassica napus]
MQLGVGSHKAGSIVDDSARKVTSGSQAISALLSFGIELGLRSIMYETRKR